MAFLKRQDFAGPNKTFSVRIEERKYNMLVDYALSNRMTLTAAVVKLLDKVLLDDLNNSKQTTT